MPRELRVHAESWPLSRPFRISRGTKSAVDVVTVHIQDGNALGRGEGVPYARYGESIESVLRQLQSVRAAVGERVSRFDLLKTLPPGAARNAVDCALWDLEAQISGVDVATVLGTPATWPLVTALTVGLDAPAAMAEAAREIASAPVVKVKVDAAEPAAQIRAVRQVCTQSQLIVDPNESWTIDTLRNLQPVLAECRVALLEQPLPVGSEFELDGFSSCVPICADESCHTAADLPTLAGRFQFVNIKLDKTGGLTAAHELLHEARAQGFGIMLGCMMCTSLSIAPAIHVARHARFVDLDPPWWLARDHAGGATLKDFRLEGPQPGFWGEPREPHQ